MEDKIMLVLCEAEKEAIFKTGSAAFSHALDEDNEMDAKSFAKGFLMGWTTLRALSMEFNHHEFKEGLQ